MEAIKNKSDKKIKILYVLSGWVPKNGGGVIVYVDNLKKEFEKNGYEIYIFHNGRFNIMRLKPYVKKYKNNIYSLVNSKYYLDFENSPYEDEIIENLFSGVLKEVNPDVVHFHDLIGMPFSLIKVAKEHSNAKIFNTFHNYYFICPKRDLIHEDGTLCEDCIAGYICNKCNTKIGNTSNYLNIIKYILWSNVRIYLPKKIYHKVLNIILKFIPRDRLDFYKKNPDSIDTSKNKNKEISKRANYSIDVLNNYLDMNISVSSEVKEIFGKFGINNDKNIVMHIGTKASEFISPINPKSKDNKDDIVFGFLGNSVKMKGLYLLINSFNELCKKNKNITLQIYGCDKINYEELNGDTVVNDKIHFNGVYKYQDLSNILSNVDVGIVPPIWYDNAPQVVFEFFSAGIPIIGSNIGGIKDFVIDNKNGLLFKSGDIKDLIRKMELIVNNPNLIKKFKKNIGIIKTMGVHKKEILNFYNKFL